MTLNFVAYQILLLFGLRAGGHQTMSELV
jgi:hypothetical protein